MYKEISILVVLLCLSCVAYGHPPAVPATTIQAYRVGDLVSKAAIESPTFGKTTGEEWGAEYPETLAALTELRSVVETMCLHPPASIKAYSPALSLIVRHSAEGHEEVRQLLQTLRQDVPIDLRLECRALYQDVEELLKVERKESEKNRLHTLLELKKFTKDEAAALLRFLPQGRPEIRHTVELSNGRRTHWGDLGRPCTAMGRVDPVKSIAHIRIDFILDDVTNATPFGSQSLKLADGESALFTHYCDGATMVWLVTASFEPRPKTDVASRPSLVAPQTTPLSSPVPKEESSPNEITSAATGMKLVLIPSGDFEMGSLQTKEELAEMYSKWNISPGSFDAEFPRHRVRISRPFYMGTTEVTQGEWQAVMSSNPSYFSKAGGGSSAVNGQDASRFPVEMVSWYDAIEYCNHLSVKDGFPAYYDLRGVERDEGSIVSATVTVIGGNGYRLPTEAEWEYACRAGKMSAFHTGNTLSSLDRAAWYGALGTLLGTPPGNSEYRTNRVGQKKANAFGLFDTHGNVDEWCQDVYDKKAYSGRSRTTFDPLHSGGSEYRVLRGGSWLDYPSFARSANRSWGTPDDRGGDIGFRVVRTP